MSQKETYYQKNKAIILQKHKKYYEKNKKGLLKKQKEYYDTMKIIKKRLEEITEKNMMH